MRKLLSKMSQGAENSGMPEVGIKLGPQDLKANTQPRRCKSRLLPQGSRSVLYLPIPTTSTNLSVGFLADSDCPQNDLFLSKNKIPSKSIFEALYI